VRILLDENLARKLVTALRAVGHEVESVHTLRMQGLDNGRLPLPAALPDSGTSELRIFRRNLCMQIAGDARTLPV
jgi:hypothetical protein